MKIYHVIVIDKNDPINMEITSFIEHEEQLSDVLEAANQCYIDTLVAHGFSETEAEESASKTHYEYTRDGKLILFTESTGQ